MSRNVFIYFLALSYKWSRVKKERRKKLQAERQRHAVRLDAFENGAAFENGDVSIRHCNATALSVAAD